MKYLTPYKIFESTDAEDLFKEFINYKLIDDLVDMSQEYIDRGYTLDYLIKLYDRSTNEYINISSGRYSQTEDGSPWLIPTSTKYVDKAHRIYVDNFLSSLKTIIRYWVRLDHGNITQPKDTINLVNRVSKLHPNETIVM